MAKSTFEEQVAAAKAVEAQPVDAPVEDLSKAVGKADEKPTEAPSKDDLDSRKAKVEYAAEQPEATDEEKEAAANDPLHAEVELVVTDEFRPDPDDENASDVIKVTVAPLAQEVEVPADGSVFTVTEREARVLEESPAIQRVGAEEDSA